MIDPNEIERFSRDWWDDIAFYLVLISFTLGAALSLALLLGLNDWIKSFLV